MNFIKTTLLGGLFILLPLMLLWIGLQEVGGLLVAMATPIADLLPVALIPEELSAPGLVATIVIAATAFVLGLAAQSDWLARIGSGIEHAVLNKVPMYRMLKIISGALIGEDTSDVNPAIVSDGKGGGEPCYVIEKHKDGRATVLMPWSPASFAGSIRIVQQANLEYVDCSLDDFSRAISQIGVGVEECMTRGSKQ
jgi:uncharacterized membrane protein